MDNDDNNGHQHKRMRVTQACMRCRKKKIKCDSTKPECAICQEANAVCEYSDARKRGPRKGYVHVLEEQVAQLKQQIAQMSGRQVTPPPVHDHPPKPELSALLSAPYTTPDSSQRRAEAAHGLPPREIVLELVDVFFKRLNVVIPIAHRGKFLEAFEKDTISMPLLWSVLAKAARYCKHPGILSDPPYLVSQRFASKAKSLIDDTLLEPTLENIQFWGIMACLEYGHGQASKAWTYVEIAVRFCQELELHKEETLSTPIIAEDGTVDLIAMATRRRIFWSIVCIDIFATGGTSRPQGFSKADIDAAPPSIPECMVMREPKFSNISVGDNLISNESLMGIPQEFMTIVQLFGQVNRFIGRARTSSSTIAWPPMPEFTALDASIRAWKESLPDIFDFTPANIEYHTQNASRMYFNLWLSMWAVWCSALLLMHRGSLAYSDIRSGDVEQATYNSIQQSIDVCKNSIRIATGVVQAVCDYCGDYGLPFLGYAAYIFATVVMTSAFSKGPEACRKSNRALQILHKLNAHLAPYWPLCERLSSMTSDLLMAHSQMYQSNRRTSSMESTTSNNNSLLIPPSSSSSMTAAPFITPNNDTSRSFVASPCGTISTITGSNPPPASEGYLPPPSMNLPTAPSFNVSPPTTTQLQTQPSPISIKGEELSNVLIPGDINFDSIDFLYDTESYGQLIFDDRPSSAASSPAHHNILPMVQGSSSSLPTSNASSLAQRPSIQQRRGASILYGLQTDRQPPIMQ